MHRTLSGWKATRSSYGISIKGIDVSTGGVMRIANLSSIEVTDSGIVAVDQNGKTLRLTA